MTPAVLKGFIPRLFVALTCFVVLLQFLFTLLTWDGKAIRTSKGDLSKEVNRVTVICEGATSTNLQSERCSCGLEQMVDQNKSLLLGTPRAKQGFLTIGIPSIKRQNGTYLFGTIDSLINCTSEEEKSEVVIVIFLADFQAEIKAEIASEIQKRYTQEMNTGFIQVIQAPATFYPRLENLKRTYNHPEEKVKWRSKQNYDYAYLLKYSVGISQYYMQLEDDILTTKKFLTAIKHYISDQKTAWVCLEFSTLGYIGKLYHSEDLDKLAKMLMLFYEEQPPDFLYIYFNIFMTQFQQRMRVPTLFQHMGYHSSLANKIQPLKDNLFDNTVKVYNGDNPPAAIFTTLVTFEPFVPNLAYSLADGFFWAKGGKKGDTFLLVFDRPEKISSIIIDTGSEYHKNDKLFNATLEVAVTLISRTSTSAECTNYVHMGGFVGGRIKIQDIPTLVPFDIFCFRVVLDQDHSDWIIFREIAVFR